MIDFDLADEFPPCTCEKCRSLCREPCWPTPDEARELMARGFGAKMMLTWVERPSGHTLLLCPAVAGYDGTFAPVPNEWDLDNADKRCTMLTDDGLCALHDLGLKPLEGRLASGCAPYSGRRVRGALCDLWETARAQTVVEVWRRQFTER